MYLSKIYIKNFRGIKELLVEFDKKLNVIIGANGQLKTSLMDAIRIFYSWGEPNRDIEITKEDFYVDITQNDDGTKTITPSTRIDICYQFEGLSAQQEGAFYQYHRGLMYPCKHLYLNALPLASMKKPRDWHV